MKKTLLIFLIIMSCSKKNEQLKDKKNELEVKEKLINFKTETMFDMNPYDLNKFDSKIKANYIDDLIIVTKLESLNACPGYNGFIQVKKDSIILVTKTKSEDICDSNEIFKLTYTIKNPNKRKFEFSMRND